MKLSTPALHGRSLEVYKALFQAQIGDTATALRNHLRDWCAVHVVLLQAGALRRGMTNAEMSKALLDAVGGDGTTWDPAVALDDPKVPENTIVTIMPDKIRPRIAAEYEGWTLLPFTEFRKRMRGFESRAFGPNGATATLDQLFDLKDHALALDGGGTTSAAQYQKAVETVCPKDGEVTYCDAHFGYRAPAATFFAQQSRILYMPDRKLSRVYFGDTWFVAFSPNGRVRVAMLEPAE